jgi:hypothetical protein
MDDSKINKEELMELDLYGISSNIKHNPIFGAKAKVWKFFHVLKKLIVTNKKTRTGKLEKSLTHLCLLCLKKIVAIEKLTNATWENALCRPTNSTHAMDHIKKLHKENNETKQVMQHSKYSQGSLYYLNYCCCLQEGIKGCNSMGNIQVACVREQAI